MKFRKFFVRFLVAFFGMYMIFHAFDLPLLKQVVASSSVWLLNWLGRSAFLSGLVIHSGPIEFFIVASCTGVVSFSVFASLLFVTKARRKAVYAVVAFPLFVAWNVFRVTTSIYFVEHTEWIHNVLWVLSTVWIMGLYILFLKKEKVNLRE